MGHDRDAGTAGAARGPGGRSEGHTRRTLLWRVAQVLARWLPLWSVELGEQVDGELVLLTAKPGEAAVTSTRQPVGSQPAAHPVRTPSTGRKPRPGTPRRVVVPLGEATPSTLSLTLHLDAAGRAELLTPSLLTALGRVMLHLLRGQEVTQRVAELSRRAHTENRELRDQRRQSEPERTLVARGPAMQEALARLEAVARFDTPVLLTGESGTGKELLAQRLHRLSPRGQRALIAINCGALPPQLVESALFGHEAGAFTGASKRHRGVFERADRGTLFLDEIGELPLAVQVKLLRALQSQEFERVGGEEKVRVDVRVIAATHRALEQMVEAGTFRRDLFYRLCVFPIRVPPLRERLEELPALAATLIGEIAGRLGMAAPRLSPALLERLQSHAWPGNVRELGNVLESAMILGQGATLEAADVPLAPAAAPTDGPLERLEDATRRCIGAALGACNGRIYGAQGAARALGLNPGTLQSKLRKLGMDRAQFIREGSESEE